MCPTTAINGLSPRPFTLATVVPSLSVVTSSANCSAASRHTRAGWRSCPGGPGAVRRRWSSSGAGIGERLAALDGRLDRHSAVEAVRDEAVLVRGVDELVDALRARVAHHRDARAQRDLRDAHRLKVLRHERYRVVVVGHHINPRLRREVEEPQHLARGGRHQEQLLGVEDGRVALRLTRRQPQLLLGGRRRDRVGAVVVVPAESGGAGPAKACLVTVSRDPWRIGACPARTWTSSAAATGWLRPGGPASTATEAASRSTFPRPTRCWCTTAGSSASTSTSPSSRHSKRWDRRW